MNRIHRWLCQSNRWKRRLENELMPWALDDFELESNLLEIGPGPGLTTDVLRRRCAELTAVEIDGKLATSLHSRLHGTNVRVVEGDATKMPFPDECFSGAVSFTMLHHVPSIELQNELFRETRRVLKVGARFLATDSRPSLAMKLIHIRDTMVLIDPDTLRGRLECAGFTGVRVEVGARAIKFQARRA